MSNAPWAARSSLQELQALEKEYDGLEAQLTRLSKLVGLDAEDGTREAFESQSRWPFNGRLEWALRWTLSKLRAADKEGSGARRNARLWTLLSTLIASLPPSIAAKDLTSCNFVAILDKTLDENYGQIYNTPPTWLGKEHAYGASKKITETVPDTIISKKRKRKNYDTSNTTSKKRQTMNHKTASSPPRTIVSLSARLRLFRALSRCLATVIGICNDSDSTHDPFSQQYLRSVFQIDSALAANVLGGWLSAITNLTQNALSDSVSILAEDDFSPYSLSDVLYMWQGRTTTPGATYANDASHFSKACLVPAVELLRLAKKKGSSSTPTEAHDAIFSKESVDMVESLIAEHVFMPAKAAYRRSGQRIDNDKKAAGTEQNSLPKLLRSLAAFLESGENHVASARSDTVPLLFNIAIRSTPLSTPRRRLAEVPWLQEVFVALSNCLGISITDDMTTLPAGINLTHFGALLSLLVKHHISLERQILDTIAWRLSGIVAANPGHINWPIVAHLIALDPNMFLSLRPMNVSDGKADAASLGDSLLAAITVVAWTSSDTGWVVSSKLGTLEYLSSQHYQLIKQDVFKPLLRAYARARDLRGFLIRWRDQLVKVIEMSPPVVSLWEDHDIIRDLSQYVRTSLSARQISDLLDQFAMELKNTTNVPTDKLNAIQLAADASILTSLITSLSYHEPELAFQSKMHALVTTSMMLLTADHVSDVALRCKILRLLAVSHRSWCSLAGTQEGRFEKVLDTKQMQSLVARKLDLAASDCRASSSFRKWAECHEALESLACMGSVSRDIVERHSIPNKHSSLSETSLKALEKLMNDQTLSCGSYSSLLFASVVAAYPILIAPYVDDVEGSAKPQRLLHTSAVLAMRHEEPDILPGMRCDIDTVVPWQYIMRNAVHYGGTSMAAVSKTLAFMNDKATLMRPEVRLVEESYLELSPSTLSRKNREKILDRITSELEDSDLIGDLQTSDWIRKLCLVLRFVEFPVDSARIVSAPESLWSIAMNLDRVILGGSVPAPKVAPILAILRKIVLIIKDGHNATKDAVVSQQYWPSLAKSISSCLPELDLTRNLAVLALCMASCNASGMILVCEPDSTDKRDAQDRLCEKLCLALKNMRNETVLAPALQAVQVYSLLAAICDLDADTFKRNRKALERALKKWNSHAQEYLAVLVGQIDLPLAALTFQANQKVQSHDDSLFDLEAATSILRARPLASEQKVMRSAVIETFRGLPLNAKVDLAKELVLNSDFRLEAAERLQVLHMIVSASISKGNHDLLPTDFIPAMTVSLADNLATSPSVRTFTLSADILAFLFRRHAKHATQCAIETTLFAIARVCSPNSAVHSTSHAPLIFLRITTLIQLLLSHHRRKLRGRFDLLLLPLQSLLRCLFLPSPTSGAKLHLPSWTPRSFPSALPARCAEAYARLLTTLIDPSLASVRLPSSSSSSNNRGLTDETKKARGYASQYVPLLIMEVCQCFLTGRLGEGSREKLMVGVWNIFEGCGRDILEARSEGMTGPARSVLRALREEWRRSGRGGRS